MGPFKKFISVVRLVKNWPLYILDHFKLLKRRDVVYRLRNGLKFKLQAHTYEATALAEVWMIQVYTPPGVKIGEDDVVVDIGGHVGMFTIFAATQARRGKVFTFEPTPENYSRLKDNLALNDIRNVTPIKMGMAGKTELRTFFVGESDTVSHSLMQNWGGSKPITIECQTLADAMKENGITRIDFLKIDCEGAENEILLNCSDDVMGAIGHITMEVHEWPGSDNTGILTRFLESNGFRVWVDFRGFHAKREGKIKPLGMATLIATAH